MRCREVKAATRKTIQLFIYTDVQRTWSTVQWTTSALKNIGNKFSRVCKSLVYPPTRGLHVFANFRRSRRGLVNSFLPGYARSRWLRAVLETIMDYGRWSLARLVVGYTGGKEGFRTRWKIYGGSVDKLCFISRDVIFIKAAGRCLLPPYTPVVGVVSRAMYGVYIAKYTTVAYLYSYLRVPRYTDMYTG